jgi:HD-GYP domain-containing protein (c-di-GMP phosphodiesterase class II)
MTHLQIAADADMWQQVQVGRPLPFNIRDADRTLLLATGQLITSEAQLQALRDRGALTDSASARARVDEARPEQLPELWAECMDGVAAALRASEQAHFRAALDDAAEPVLALIERDPDLAIFQVLRQNPDDNVRYGVTHSVHASITTHLVAQRLRWSPGQTLTAFKAALTMNIAMVELQGRLATQVSALTPLQRATIREHPMRGVEMLQSAGIVDRDWLDGVAQHHEAPDGSGYPLRLRDIGEIASLLRRVDIYTAKLSGRSTRGALAANQAGREIFMQDPTDPMNNALVKEFGIYPPGCCVRLASGETGIVVKRGPSANTPIVASLRDASGRTLAEPVRRDSSRPGFQVVDTLLEQDLHIRISPEKLVLLACA